MTDHIEPARITEEERQRLEDQLRAAGIRAPGVRFSELATDRIEPALSAEEWAARPDMYDIVTRWEESDLPKIIAAANADLPDSDHRKITREMVSDARLAATNAGHAKWSARYNAIADALESYLPPESRNESPGELDVIDHIVSAVERFHGNLED